MGFWAKGAEVARDGGKGRKKDNPNIEYNDAHQEITASITASIIRDTCAYLHSLARNFMSALGGRKIVAAVAKRTGYPPVRSM